MLLWYTSLILVTFGRLGNLIIGFLTISLPYLPDFRPTTLPHGLEDAPVVHQLDHGHLGEVRRPHYWLSHGQYVVYGAKILAIWAIWTSINEKIGTRRLN